MVVIGFRECKKWKVDLKNRKVEKANDVGNNVGGDNVPNGGQTFASSLLSILDSDAWYINLRAFVHPTKGIGSKGTLKFHPCYFT